MPWGDGKKKHVVIKGKQARSVLRDSGGHSTGGALVKAKHVKGYAVTHHRGRSTSGE